MRRILTFLVIAGAGWLTAQLGGVTDLDGSSSYFYVVSALLAIGLFGGAYGIDLASARRDAGTIGLAVTVGVVLKAAIIGGIMGLVYFDRRYVILGVAVAQIDPLSVAAVLRQPRLSPRARSVLASWASFDDPVSVLLLVYGSAFVLPAAGRRTAVADSLTGYLANLGANALLAAAGYGLWRLIHARWLGLAEPIRLWVARMVLVALLAFASWQFLMLGVAILGLFFRPQVAELIGRVVDAAAAGAAFVLGLLLVGGVKVPGGLLLGVLAFAAQIIVSAGVITRRMPIVDRVHLSLAQQNGVTAIILALLLAPRFAPAVGIVGVAIVVTNILHAATNRIADACLARQPPLAMDWQLPPPDGPSAARPCPADVPPAGRAV